MSTKQQVRELTAETFEIARGRAEELVSAGAEAVRHAVDEVSERAPDIDTILRRKNSHKLRNVVLVAAVIVLIVVVAKLISSGSTSDEPYDT